VSEKHHNDPRGYSIGTPHKKYTATREESIEHYKRRLRVESGWCCLKVTHNNGAAEDVRFDQVELTPPGEVPFTMEDALVLEERIGVLRREQFALERRYDELSPCIGKAFKAFLCVVSIVALAVSIAALARGAWW